MASFFETALNSPGFWANAPKLLPSVGNINTSTAFNPSTGGAAKGMDPATLALGLGSSLFGSIGSAIAGDSAADAAERAAKQKTKEDIAAGFRDFGLEFLGTRYKTGTGAAANRMNALKEAADAASFQAYNPAMQNLQSRERFNKLQNYAASLSAAMPGYVSPLNIFS
jgi:hypothetical protein